MTCAGIVLYNPDLERLQKNVNAIKDQVDLVILVDNCSDNFELVKLQFECDSHIRFISNKENLGIATALNQIVRFAIGQSCEWVLTLDQDSVAPPNLITTYEIHTVQADVGVIGPRIEDINFIRNEGKQRDVVEDTKKCISSASFINTKVFTMIGGFDDSMFIDMVDFDYCFRVHKAGYRVLKIHAVSLTHQLGNIELHRFFGFKLPVSNHSPLRNYYYARNCVYYFRKNRDATIFYNLTARIIKVVLYETPKREKIRSIRNGLRDGCRMKINRGNSKEIT